VLRGSWSKPRTGRWPSSVFPRETRKRRGEVVHKGWDVVPFDEYLTFGRLDGQWKLKEVMPPARGAGAVAQENLDEDSSLLQLRWYYTKKRAL
jgi:hypothetical protein